MDPITAVSVAAAVVQFSDFGARLLKETTKTYKSVSGMTSDIVELSTIGVDLHQLSSSIEEKSSRLVDLSDGLSTSEQTLLRLCHTAQELSKELGNALNQLQTHNTGKLKLAVESFAVALRKCWSRDRIDGFRERITDVRRQMMMAMLTFLWEESKSGTHDVQKLSRQQNDMISTLNQIDDSTQTLNKTLIQVVNNTKSSEDREYEEAVESFWSSDWNNKTDSLEEDTKAEVGAKAVENTGDLIYARSITKSLDFDDISSRETAIFKAYKETFEWLLKTPRLTPDGTPRWSDFLSWLTGPSEDIYWMTGKPGSGKSTLMKFISSHSKMIQSLRDWANPRPCLVASFYFWNAGSSMQKTQEGLLRTLLYQCLKQQPQIVPKLCPKRWALCKVFGVSALQTAPMWNKEELLETFSALNMLAGQDFNLALFIDGLDELDGDHKQLIDLIRPFRSNPGTKICVSSRPWNVFVDAFSCGPSLRLQDLTRGDIELFVDGKFNSTPAFRELQDALPDDASRLMEAIIEKAQGVFLWVAVVVNTILESITEGDNLSDLKTMVNELPSDLSELYDGIWCRIKPRYIAHSSQLFQIYKAILGEESVITMWLANENDPYDTDLSTIAFGRIKLIIQTMKRRLDSRTRGLLEVTDGHVDYLHRSVAEWVNFKWSVICSEAPVDFDPNLALLKAVTVEMSRVKKGIKDGGHTIIEDFWRAVQACLRYAARVRDYPPNFRELIEILDRLDKQCAEVAAFNPRGDPVPPIYAGAFTPESIEKRQGLPHWSTTQVRNEPDISFLALTAQFAISPYVRAKVTAEPSLVIPGPESCSILSHAVFGLAGFTDLHVRDRPLESGFPGPTSRYQLIQFLIETEVAATTDDSIKKQESASRQLAIYQRLVDNRFNGGIVQMPDGSLEGYYEAVCKLFEMNSDTRRLKSLKKERGPGREDHISEKTDKKEPSKSTPRSRQRFVKRIQKLFKDKPSS